MFDRNPKAIYTAPVSIATPRERAGGAKAVLIDGPASPLSAPSDEDDLTGAERLVADPDSPTSRLLERAARHSMRSSEVVGTPERKFSYVTDIARNPQLARAAHAEIDAASGHSSPSTVGPGRGRGSADGSSATGGDTPTSQMGVFRSVSEIDRQTAAIVAFDQDAAQETAINLDMGAVMLGRLKSGRSAAERVLSVIQAFASAEAAYARALEAVAKIDLAAESDGPSLRAAMAAFSDLPLVVGNAHAAVSAALGEAVRLVHAVVVDVRAACDAVNTGAQAAKRNVDTSRRGLKASLVAHKDACRAFDAAALEREKAAFAPGNVAGGVGSGRPRGVDTDPWLTEGRLVESQADLHRAQAAQRRYLAVAFRRVGVLERRRIDAARSALAALTAAYRTAVPAPPAVRATERLEALLEAVDCEADLEAFSRTAAKSTANGDALSARQAEMIDQLRRDLLASAEIVRQGDMERFDAAANKWVKGYAVLTRAGFLHWFAAPKDGSATGAWGPAGVAASSLSLANCSFEQGDAPAFRLIEAVPGGWLGSRQRSQTLKTRQVDACMDWAADLRESITACGR